MAVDLAALIGDLRREYDALERIIDPLERAQWELPTPAEGWAVRDQISHLAWFDEAATSAMTDPDQFRKERDEAIAAGGDLTEDIARRFRPLLPAEVHAWFRAARASFCATASGFDAKLRVPWYGPDMSVASSVTARIMETWAHGQDVADALQVARETTPALRHVAHLGVATFANSFVTRGLDVPADPVRVVLVAPDGDAWEWGPPDAADRIEGEALDFCLVVTQRRHRDDTSLQITGAVADRWMQIAQAFAGGAGKGRPPGAAAPS